MPTLQVQEAYSFYRTYILEYSRNRTPIYQQYGFSWQGSVGSKDWGVFAAILLNDRARSDDGADLENYDVKSATDGDSFEYQYHGDRGVNQLLADRDVDHIFVTRNETDLKVEVWFVECARMIPSFDQWLSELQQDDQTVERQKYCRSVTCSFVRNQGFQILEIRDGELNYYLEAI